MYELRQAEKRYGEEDTEVVAVASTDLEVSEGEFVALVGPSGSGKTTMLQLLGALDRPSSGEVGFEGRDLGVLSYRELARLRLETLGFVFQQFNLIPTLTAAENVEAALAPNGASAADRRGRAGELLERVGLAARADHVPAKMSGGEQQRVAISRALANRPRVLLADEPTGNLDTKTGDDIIALLFRLWEETGMTLVLVTHDQELAEQAPRVLGMRDGRVTDDRAGVNERVGAPSR